MRIVLLGPPGAGKGTQADVLTKKLFVPHISTGDMFRAAMSAGTPMGNEAKEYINKGILVPDEITIGIIKDRISHDDCREGFLLDGFPRTLAQAEALDKLMGEMNTTLDAVINISVPDEQLILRLSGRRMCKSCGSIYHQLYNAPQKEGICDNCGSELYQRSDDQEDTVKNRLKVYHEQTAPLIDYYAKKEILHNINGDQPINAVLADMGEALGEKWN